MVRVHQDSLFYSYCFLYYLALLMCPILHLGADADTEGPALSERWDQEFQGSWEKAVTFPYDRQLFTQLRVRYGAVDNTVVRFELREGARLGLFTYPKMHLQCSLNTVYISSWHPIRGEHLSEGQFEFECNPTWIFSKQYQLVQRNRYELRKIEYEATWRSILRHRSRFVKRLKTEGSLKEVRTSFELFYNFNFHQFEQLRLTPLELMWEDACQAQISFGLTWRIFFHDSYLRYRLMWTVDWVKW